MTSMPRLRFPLTILRGPLQAANQASTSFRFLITGHNVFLTDLICRLLVIQGTLLSMDTKLSSTRLSFPTTTRLLLSVTPAVRRHICNTLETVARRWPVIRPVRNLLWDQNQTWACPSARRQMRHTGHLIQRRIAKVSYHYYSRTIVSSYNMRWCIPCNSYHLTPNTNSFT